MNFYLRSYGDYRRFFVFLFAELYDFPENSYLVLIASYYYIFFRSEHYNNIQKEENLVKETTLKNTAKVDSKHSSSGVRKENSSLNSPGRSKEENLDPNKSLVIVNDTNQNIVKNSDRPLKCLETLAEKAGITFDEKYDTSPSQMEKSQSPQVTAAQQAQANAQQMPLQLMPEHFQQLQQQFQLQQAFAAGSGTIVKQEYPNQHQQGMTTQEQVQQIQQVQQMQIVDNSAPQSPHQNNQNAQNTMSLQQAVQAGQVPAEWQHGRVQVLQQPIQNSYLPQMYNPTPQLVMSGNILHGGLGQQQIQLIAAGKPFQGGQLGPQMLTTAQGKQVIASGAQGFSGYALPTIPSSQAQTLLFSPVGVIPQPQQNQQQNQQNMMTQMQAQGTQNKSGSMQDNQKQMANSKVMQKSAQVNVSQANSMGGQQQGQIQVTQTMPTAQILNPIHQSGGQTMQFTSPWPQLQTQLWATNGLQPQAVLASNQIIFRGTNPDGTPQMFIQQAPQQTQQTVQSQQNRKHNFSNHLCLGNLIQGCKLSIEKLVIDFLIPFFCEYKIVCTANLSVQFGILLCGSKIAKEEF